MSAGLGATEGRRWPEEVTGNKTQADKWQRGDKVRQWSCPPFLRDRVRLMTFSGFKVIFYNGFLPHPPASLRINALCGNEGWGSVDSTTAG